MEKAEIITFLSTYKNVSISKEDKPEFVSMFNYCLDKGFYMQEGLSYRISAKGIDLINGIEENNATHIGHNIIGDISHSDLSIEALNHSINPPANTQSKQSKTMGIIWNWIITNIWKFLLGFAIGYTIWYFTIRQR